jgi:hypothetical protein
MNCNGLLDNRINSISRIFAFITVTLLTLSTPTILALSSVDPLGCTITWPHIEDQTIAMGGIRIAEMTTPEMCQDFCTYRPHCIAVEFDYSIREDTHGCWYHENMKDLIELFLGDNVTHYQIESSCPERRNGASPAQVTDDSYWQPNPSSGNRLRSFESGLAAVMTTVFVSIFSYWKL